MTTKKVKINRAPVLTLWAAVVAERLGYDRDAALTLGKGVAGLNAQSKGRRLGIFEEPAEPKKKPAPPASTAGKSVMVKVLGRPVPAVKTDEGVRATIKGKPIEPAGVSRYLEQKFGDELTDVRAAMEYLAKAFRRDQLETEAYALYEKFRPVIPEGTRGWGAAGELDVTYIRSLAR